MIFDIKKFKNHCLTCRYEPNWSDWDGGREYKRCSGYCKKDITITDIPKCYNIHKEKIIRYGDDSGIFFNCPAWKPKLHHGGQ